MLETLPAGGERARCKGISASSSLKWREFNLTDSPEAETKWNQGWAWNDR